MMKRPGLCLLPLLFVAACSTNQTAAVAPRSAASDLAMLPDAAPLPSPRPQAASAASVTEAGYAPTTSRHIEGGSPELNALIAKYARHYEVPESLVRRVVKRESSFRPEARNGPYWGLMQILPATARGMGFEGPASALLDAETNLKYAVKYLRGAYLVAGGDHDQSVRLYARGYYYDAKRKGMLEVTGLRKPRKRAQPEVVLASNSRTVTQPVPPTAAEGVGAEWQAGLMAASAGPATPPSQTGPATPPSQTGPALGARAEGAAQAAASAPAHQVRALPPAASR